MLLQLLGCLPLLSPCGEDPVSQEVLMELAARGGSELSWTDTWAAAAEQARASDRLVLVLFRRVPAVEGPDHVALGPFMDRDIIDLVRERYVPLRFDPSMDAPFKSHDSYGMGPFSFGTSVLAALPDGTIVGDTFTLEPTTLFELLAGAAREHGPAVAPPAELSGRELAEWHVRRGEDNAALALLALPSTLREALLLARVHRRSRRGPEALAVLAAGRSAGARPTDLALRQGQVLMSQDRVQEALDSLDLIPAGHPDALEAAFVRIQIQLARGETEEAVELATTLVTDHADSRWSWKGAQVLLYRPALESLAGRSLAWPSPDLAGMLKATRFEQARTPHLARERQDAARFLLSTQRRDGSWPNGAEVMSSPAPHRWPLTVATTALSARALLELDADPDVADALDRAFAFLFDARELTEREGDPTGGFDYTVWSKACQLLLLSDAIERGVVRRSDWRHAMQGLVDELEAKQKPSGGWTYYPGEQDVSFSFVTAFVLLGLHAADVAGIEVPAEMIEPALDSLEATRSDEGLFAYMVYPGVQRRWTTSGDAGRGPLCALALLTFERADVDDVQEALDRFLRYRAVYAREHGKTVMHCGPEGEGSHYLMFDYAYCAAACAALPEDRRGPYRAAIVDQIRNARLAGGAYLDNPILGDRFGTAMALWALQRLSGDEE